MTVTSVSYITTGTADKVESIGSSVELTVITTMLSIMAIVGTIGNALAIYVFANLKTKVS